MSKSMAEGQLSRALPAFVLTLGLLLPACGATRLMRGIREPDLNAIRVGDSRAQAERKLGKRIWQPGSADGLTYDVYQYKAAQDGSIVWGSAAFAFDFLTLGTTEMHLRDAEKFHPLKQVAVGYDAQDRVRYVSQPWNVPEGTLPPCAARRPILPNDSGVPAAAVPSSPEKVRAASLDLRSEQLRRMAVIDGVKPATRVVELPPGPHTVNFDGQLGGSVLLSAARLTAYPESLNVQLLPGRLYRLRQGRFYASAGTRTDIFWIEDVQSGETLQCASP